MRQRFKFGRPYIRMYSMEGDLEYSFHYSPQGTYGTSGSSGCMNPPQKYMGGIKKFYYKGKYPRPRNN